MQHFDVGVLLKFIKRELSRDLKPDAMHNRKQDASE